VAASIFAAISFAVCFFGFALPVMAQNYTNPSSTKLPLLVRALSVSLCLCAPLLLQPPSVSHNSGLHEKLPTFVTVSRKHAAAHPQRNSDDCLRRAIKFRNQIHSHNEACTRSSSSKRREENTIRVFGA
jgi:hypothetical protein